MEKQRMPDPSAGWCAGSRSLEQYVDGHWHTFIITCTRKLHHLGKHAFRWDQGAQLSWESAWFTLKRSEVQSLSRPQLIDSGQLQSYSGIMAQNSLVKAEKVSEIGKLYMQGIQISKIAKKMELSVPVVRGYIKEWEDYISQKAADNSEVLDNFLENVYRFDAEIDMMNEEIWETIELAKEHGVHNTKLQALRLSKDLMETRARLFQLLSPRMETGYIERTKRVERVNGILSAIIRDTISTCDTCSSTVFRKLEDAYRLHPEFNPGEDEIVEGEIVE